MFPEGLFLAASSLNLAVTSVGRSFAGNSALLHSDVIDFATLPAFNLVPRVITLAKRL